MNTFGLFIVFVEAFVNVLGGLLTLAIFTRVVQSWVPTLRLPLGLGEMAWGVSEPILAPLRRVLPSAGGLDLSPLVALLAIQFLQTLVLRLLPLPV